MHAQVKRRCPTCLFIFDNPFGAVGTQIDTPDPTKAVTFTDAGFKESHSPDRDQSSRLTTSTNSVSPEIRLGGSYHLHQGSTRQGIVEEVYIDAGQ